MIEVRKGYIQKNKQYIGLRSTIPSSLIDAKILSSDITKEVYVIYFKINDIILTKILLVDQDTSKNDLQMKILPIAQSMVTEIAKSLKMDSAILLPIENTKKIHENCSIYVEKLEKIEKKIGDFLDTTNFLIEENEQTANDDSKTKKEREVSKTMAEACKLFIPAIEDLKKAI